MGLIGIGCFFYDWSPYKVFGALVIAFLWQISSTLDDIQEKLSNIQSDE